MFLHIDYKKNRSPDTIVMMIDDDDYYYVVDVDENGDEVHDVSSKVDALQDGAREHRLDDNRGRNR